MSEVDHTDTPTDLNLYIFEIKGLFLKLEHVPEQEFKHVVRVAAPTKECAESCIKKQHQRLPKNECRIDSIEFIEELPINLLITAVPFRL